MHRGSIHYPTVGLDVHFITDHKEGKKYSFRMNGNMTLHNQKGLSNIVKPYECNFSDFVPRCPDDWGQEWKTLALESDIVDPASGWIKDGELSISFTFDY